MGTGEVDLWLFFLISKIQTLRYPTSNFLGLSESMYSVCSINANQNCFVTIKNKLSGFLLLYPRFVTRMDEILRKHGLEFKK